MAEALGAESYPESFGYGSLLPLDRHLSTIPVSPGTSERMPKLGEGNRIQRPSESAGENAETFPVEDHLNGLERVTLKENHEPAAALGAHS